MFLKVCGIEKCYTYERGIEIFRRNFLSHSAEKVRRGYPLTFLRTGISSCLRTAILQKI